MRYEYYIVAEVYDPKGAKGLYTFRHSRDNKLNKVGKIRKLEKGVLKDNPELSDAIITFFKRLK